MISLNTTGDKIKEIFTIAGACKNQIQINWTPEDMQFFSIDPSTSAMILGRVKKEFFTSYEADDTTMVVDHNAFATPLKRLKKNDAYMSFSDDGRITLVEKNTRWFIELLGESGRNMPNPGFETGVSFQLPLAEFSEELTRVFDGGEVTTFTATKDYLMISGGTFESEDKVRSLITAEKIPEFRFNPVDGEEKIASHFNTDFLKDILPIIPKDSIIEVQIDNNKPVRIKFKNESGTGAYVFILAPYISNE